MLAMLLEERPRVVSFHFGLPKAERISALRQAGIVLLATATNLAEACSIGAAGIDAVIAQGFEAGGHRGVFDPDAADDCIGTMALTRLLVRNLGLPVIAAGGIVDGAGIAACLSLAQRGPARYGLHRLSGVGGGRGISGRTPEPRFGTYSDDDSNLGDRSCILYANKFTALGNEAEAGNGPGLSDRLRCGQGADSCRESRWRSWIWRRMGRTGSQIGPHNARCGIGRSTPI